jgi:hypothetical protein
MGGTLPEVNRLRPGLTWEVIVDTLLTQIVTARGESNRVRGTRNLNQVLMCGRYLAELEDLIKLSNPMRDWISAPEPIIEKLREEALGVEELWAKKLAKCTRLWLQPVP